MKSNMTSQEIQVLEKEAEVIIYENDLHKHLKGVTLMLAKTMIKENGFYAMTLKGKKTFFKRNFERKA